MQENNATIINEEVQTNNEPSGGDEPEKTAENAKSPAFDYEAQNAALEKKAKELAEKESLLNFRQLQLDTIGLLEAENIPVTVVNLVIGKDLDSTKQNIAVFKKEFDKALQTAVGEKLRGNAPRASAAGYQPDYANKKDVRQIMSGGN